MAKTTEKSTKSKKVGIFKKIVEVLDNSLFPKKIKCLSCKEEIFDNRERNICNSCEKKFVFNNEKICKQCGSKLTNGKTICNSCKNKETHYNRARSPFVYDGEIKNIIHRIKYNGERYLAKEFAKYMCDEIASEDLVFDLITCIPLTKRRERTRGFNQSFLFAKEISNAFKKPILETLKRTKETPSQTNYGYEDRMKNLDGAFSPINIEKFKGKKILLVDDVLTTGATSESASLVLMNAGANEINVITLASTPYEEIKEETSDKK